MGPLAGVKIVELAGIGPGPFAGMMLSDMGADIIRVDRAQQVNPAMFDKTNLEPLYRGRRSIGVDLKNPEGVELVLRLVESADALFEGFRPGVTERLGVGPDVCLARNPRLVYGLITGYGTEGPEADAPAYDIAAWWSRAGIASLLAPPGGALPFQRGGMGDHTVAMTAAGMISAALVARERTGRGQLVSTSLLRQGAYTIGFDLNTALMWGQSIRVGTRTAMGNPCLNNYVAGDGRRFWIVGLEGERHWPPLARAVGHPEWLTDPRFATGRDRAAHAAELVALLDEVFATRDLASWAEVFATEPDFFWAPVNTVDDLLSDAQFVAAGGIVEVPDGTATTPMVAMPADFHGTPGGPRRVAPRLGEHTDEVLAELGNPTAP